MATTTVLAIRDHVASLLRLFALLPVAVLMVLGFGFCRHLYIRGWKRRIDELFQERTNFAQVHQDSVLQTLEASKLLAADALEHVHDQIWTRDALNLLSDWLNRASIDSHAALRALEHPVSSENDFVEALRDVANECCSELPIVVRVSTVGHRRTMHSVVLDEIYRIAQEAIRNACNHSQAQEMQIEVEYEASFHLRIRDNGRGIESDLAESRTDGNISLAGMRARAASLGGRLDIKTEYGIGTTISLAIPGRVAFRDSYERVRR